MENDLYERLLLLCCAEWEISLEAVKSEKRYADCVFCRTCFIKIAKEHYGLGFDKIGSFINRTRSNCNYLYNKN